MFHINFEIDLPLVLLGVTVKKNPTYLSHQQSLKMSVYV